MKLKNWAKAVNSLAVIVLAGSAAWLYLVRERLVAVVGAPAPPPPSVQTWQSVDAGGIDWRGDIRVGDVLISPIDIGTENITVVRNRQESAWLADGWERVEDDDKPENARVYRKQERFRVLVSFAPPRGEQELLVMFEMDGSRALTHFHGDFEIEAFLESQSVDLPGIPAPPDTRRWFSLVDARGGGIVSYNLMRSDRQSIYAQYLKSMIANNWQPLHTKIAEAQMILLKRGSETCLIGWSDSYDQDRSYITVVLHGN